MLAPFAIARTLLCLPPPPYACPLQHGEETCLSGDDLQKIQSMLTLVTFVRFAFLSFSSHFPLILFSFSSHSLLVFFSFSSHSLLILFSFSSHSLLILFSSPSCAFCSSFPYSLLIHAPPLYTHHSTPTHLQITHSRPILSRMTCTSVFSQSQSWGVVDLNRACVSKARSSHREGSAESRRFTA
jgi:hypothetical protein